MKLLLLNKYDNQKLRNIHEIYLSAFANSSFQILRLEDFEDFYSMGAKIYTIYLNQDLIAYAVFLINGKVAEILSIGVKSNYQKQGYGKKLIYEFLKKFNTISKVNLEVSCKNSDAINFYLSMGFSKIGLRKNYYTFRKGDNKGKKIDALLLELNN